MAKASKNWTIKLINGFICSDTLPNYRKDQERIFQKLFAAAEIAKYSREELEIYEESLKYYRDLNNIVYSAKVEGKIEGKVEGKIERTNELAKSMKADGMSYDKISKYTGLSEEEIEKL